MLPLLHILKMMMNATMALQPTAKYSTRLFSLLFSTPLLILFFLAIPLTFPVFVCVHSFALPFPLLFFVVFQSHSLHSCYCEFQNFKNAYNFQQQTQIAFDDYPIYLFLKHFACRIHFFTCQPFFN